MKVLILNGSPRINGKCVFDDAVNEIAPKFEKADGLVVATSQYWNSVHGREQGEAEKDIEGLQTMRTLARNMTFLMKSIALGKEKYGLPEKEEWTPTHFING
ncbi:MAG: NAD(P)H-dependent oxidoreductase [Lachnospiraceae bacterium]|nr:NAD(P)H-dependent oxidoreductase [Lachnospiraceae bacterium]